MTTTLTTLKARVDEAEEGSWELNWLVAEALDLQRFAVAQRIERETQESIDAAGLTEHRIGRARREAMYTLNRYTQSIDAALALIESKCPDARGGLDFGWNGDGTCGASIEPLLFDAKGDDYYGHCYAKARTPALALCSALLAALIAKEQA